MSEKVKKIVSLFRIQIGGFRFARARELTHGPWSVLGPRKRSIVAKLMEK